MADSPRRTGDLTSYTDIARQLERLPDLVRDARRARQLSLRVAAEQAGLSFTTLSRVENGGDCSLANAMLILLWLDQRPEVPRG